MKNHNSIITWDISGKRGDPIPYFKCRDERSDLNSEVLHRLSNGLAEAYNNVPKDLKRFSNGVSNFDYTRNRLLWANRHNPPILAVPRSLKQVHSPGETRGPYKKKSD